MFSKPFLFTNFVAVFRSWREKWGRKNANHCIHCNVKKFFHIPVPSRDVTYQTLPGQEQFIYDVIIPALGKFGKWHPGCRGRKYRKVFCVHRLGGDAAHGAHQHPDGQQDEEVPEGPDAAQGPEGEAHGRGVERDEGAEAVRVGALLRGKAARHQGAGGQRSQEGKDYGENRSNEKLKADTGDKHSFANISANFPKKFKTAPIDQLNTQGTGGHWFMKKTWSRKFRVSDLVKNPIVIPQG